MLARAVEDFGTDSLHRTRRLGTWAAVAMVVSETVGVGIFLTPATMMRTLHSTAATLLVWTAMGVFSAAGALCYAELATRFPRAGGPYVFLREAFGPRTAFLYGWMSLLIVDPGLAAGLGIGFAQYVLAATGGSAGLTVPLAMGGIVGFGALTLLGLGASARMLRWSATAKLTAVGALVAAAVVRAGGGAAVPQALTRPSVSAESLAPAVIAAFFAFGGWWDLGKMAGEVDHPRRTLPRALIGGVALVAAIYVLVSVAFALVTAAPATASDQAFVAVVGTALFGESAGRLLALIVVIAVSGSLAAVLLGAPRVYLAMARDHLFPSRLARQDERTGTAPAATAIQVALACLFVALGTFDQILGYFIPAAVLFLGLSAAAVLVLPRPTGRSALFRAPLHPLPISAFLIMIVAMLALFAMGQPRQTLLGAAVIAAGIPVSRRFIAH